MKRALLLLLTLTASLVAAPWDGTRGPFSLLTYTSPGFLPGVPSIVGTPDFTVIRIVSSDSTIAAVKVLITYNEGDQERQAMIFSNLTDGLGGIVTTISQAQIVSIQLTELRAGATY